MSYSLNPALTAWIIDVFAMTMFLNIIAVHKRIICFSRGVLEVLLLAPKS